LKPSLNIVDCNSSNERCYIPTDSRAMLSCSVPCQ